ncbi:unnamed protein product [Dovyalis caffra]|uniref:NB-ARC domain-containing protein n=1 Tax=Dovyalis caffra TaxID=77055 RepID=A0AAV1RVD2_9ROSI|nr:unnamed protein product [Dovyalis caffra]
MILVKAAEIHDEIEELKKQWSMFYCSVPDPPKFVVGLEGPLDHLKKMLLGEGVSVAVLSAPEGYGKSTLAKKFCREKEAEEKFKDNISFVIVSKKPSLKVIARRLLLHKGNSNVPEFESDEEAVHCLEQFMKKIGNDPILLVLDHVWPESQSLIDKLKFEIPNYKVLVIIYISILADHSSYTPPDDLVDKVLSQHSMTCTILEMVKACCGVPLALTVIGRSLCGQPAATWQNRAMELSKGDPIFESNPDLHNYVQKSLEVLDDKVGVKECYMDLGQRIPANALIDMWVELYGLDDEGIDSIARLHELDTLNLVDLEVPRKDATEIDGYYDDHFVMQHDLLRQMVIHQCSSELPEQRKRLIVDSNLQATEVEALVLNCRTKNYKLPEFMEKMDKLKAFSNIDEQLSSAFPNLSEINIDSCTDLTNLPVWFCDLVHLKKLSINSCRKLSELPQEIGKLVNLEVLRLCFCVGLVKLPETIKNLSKLSILDKSDCASIVELPTEIGDLHKLRKLHMNGCSNISKLPPTVESLKSLQDVICDKKDATLWQTFKPSLERLKIKVTEVLEYARV